MLQLEDVARRFGPVRAVDGVTLSVAEGQVLAIVGESGCGKSTLGRLALRLITPDRGRVIFAGEDLGRLSPRALRARRRNMQLIFQDPYGSLDPRMTVEQAVAEPLILHNIGAGAQEEDILLTYPITGHFRVDANVAKQLRDLGT